MNATARPRTPEGTHCELTGELMETRPHVIDKAYELLRELQQKVREECEGDFTKLSQEDRIVLSSVWPVVFQQEFYHHKIRLVTYMDEVRTY